LSSIFGRFITARVQPSAGALAIPPINGSWFKIEHETGMYVSLRLMDREQATHDRDAIKNYVVANKIEFGLDPGHKFNLLLSEVIPYDENMYLPM
jgi:hypothetical protein